MTNIDDVGRRAGRAVVDEVSRTVDVEAGLARVRADAATGRGSERPSTPRRAEADGTGRRRSFVLTVAAALVVAVVVTVAVALGRGGDEQIATDDTPDTPAPTAPGTPGTTAPGPPRGPDSGAPEVVDVVAIDTIPQATGLNVAVSPDGRWVAHQGPDRRVCLTSLTGAAAAWCGEIDGFGFRQMSWSPDSVRFTGGDEVQLGFDTRTVLVDVDGSWVTLDLDVDEPLLLASFAGDARSIVGVLPPDEDADIPFRLALVDTDTGATRVLAEYPGPIGGTASVAPLPIDATRSVLFGSADPDVPSEILIRSDTSLFVLDHDDGTLTPIAIPDDVGIPRVPIDATRVGAPVVLVGKLDVTSDRVTTFAELELWDIEAGSVTTLPATPDGLTSYGVAVAPDGTQLASAWIDDEGELQVGIAAVEDLLAAEAADTADTADAADTADPDPSAWSITTLTGDAPAHFSPFDRPVCWCGDRIVVVADGQVHVVEPAGASD